MTGRVLWRRIYMALSLLTMPGFSPLLQAEDRLAENEVEFDAAMLSARGVDGKTAEWFRAPARFMSGPSRVKLWVNGIDRGNRLLNFDHAGMPCLNAGALRQAQIAVPRRAQNKADFCVDLRQQFPPATVTPVPGEARIELVVPTDALVAEATEQRYWPQQGTAAMINYDLNYLTSSSNNSALSFTQLASVVGANHQGWIMRSRQTLTAFQGENRWQHQAAYLQRSFQRQKTVFQAGQVNLVNSLFGSGQVFGMQIFPETALLRQGESAALIEGIADTQSVVEVRQSGALLYSTTVPAGPFTLSGFSLLNSQSDLLVKIIGSQGEVRQFSVSASEFLIAAEPGVQGLSLGIGRLQQPIRAGSPWLTTAGLGWGVTRRIDASVGALASADYQAAAVSINLTPRQNTRVSAVLRGADDRQYPQRGLSLTTFASHALTPHIGLMLNLSRQTVGYRELSEVPFEDVHQQYRGARQQLGAGMNWSHTATGSLALSWSRSHTPGRRNINAFRLGWSRRMGRAVLGANLERHHGGSHGHDNRFYLSLSLPLSAGQLNAWHSDSGRGARSGVRYSQSPNQDRSWNIASERNSRSGRTELAAGFDSLNPRARLGGNVTLGSQHDRSAAVHAQGSGVWYQGQWLLSPSAIGDTLGIARVGEEPGVRLDTPSGPAWTNGQGLAVLPTLGAYQRSLIQVDTRRLKRSRDIDNALQHTDAGRGAVNEVNFSVTKTRRVWIKATTPAGEPLPEGASVFDQQEQFMAMTADDGSFFIMNAQPGMGLVIDMPDGYSCRLLLDLPTTPPEGKLFETGSPLCQ
ncbi:MAG: fimbria/pilus outer membrane usher protein [Rouxiella aceris]|uniref:fimbria/pilus outer membrane usher protein n=1 Tax=Rouxiella aceris TaxID=2703884 RepID=UPI0028495B58|nr:fimbria/pilus outer membrane usher protein [Rouxiella aceris]MDR3433650.1 fimbria/pilus outer membrane usher protein [Rouxiella aceris]